MRKIQKQFNQKGFTQHHFLDFHKSGAGFSLFEILIAIAVFAVVGVTAAQLVSVSLLADKTSGQKTVGVGFAQETMAAVNSVVTEKWNNIYNLNKGSANKYYPANTATLCGSIKWCLVAGTASSTANNLIYKRDLYIENVCRATTGDKDITGITDTGGTSTTDCTVSGGSPDLSTEKITAIVSWEDTGGNQLGSITLSNYFTRSRNTAAVQTDWNDSGGDPPGSGEVGNFGTNLASIDNSVSTSTPSGSITLKQQ